MNHFQKKQQGFDLFDFIFKNQTDSIYWSVGHSATAFRNFAIRQLSIPQNDIRQRDQMAKIFRKKCLAINYSEKRHSETFIPKISIRKKI